MSPKKILIIGSGITGALCSLNLSKALPLSNVIVWDKARGAGGRMSTTRTDNGHKADLGAQYITTSKENLERFNSEYQPLLNKGILSNLSAPVEGMKPFASDVVHFVAPDGMGSVVKSILTDTEASVIYNRRVNSILVEGEKYKVTAEDGSCEECDVVISTIPVPQFLSLPGASHILDESSEKKLQQVEYSTRFVLLWYYSDNAPRPDWGSKYLNDDIFRFVSLDNVKRNKLNEPAAVVFHTSIQYGEKNKLKTKAELEDELNANAKRLFPDWPTPSSTKCHKWLYSQVVKRCPDADGCLVLNQHPTFVLAGDAFSESNFNGCIQSARAVVAALCNKETSL